MKLSIRKVIDLFANFRYRIRAIACDVSQLRGEFQLKLGADSVIEKSSEVLTKISKNVVKMIQKS